MDTKKVKVEIGFMCDYCEHFHGVIVTPILQSQAKDRKYLEKLCKTSLPRSLYTNAAWRILD